MGNAATYGVAKWRLWLALVLHKKRKASLFLLCQSGFLPSCSIFFPLIVLRCAPHVRYFRESPDCFHGRTWNAVGTKWKSIFLYRSALKLSKWCTWVGWFFHAPIMFLYLVDLVELSWYAKKIKFVTLKFVRVFKATQCFLNSHQVFSRCLNPAKQWKW